MKIVCKHKLGYTLYTDWRGILLTENSGDGIYIRIEDVETITKFLLECKQKIEEAE